MGRARHRTAIEVATSRRVTGAALAAAENQMGLVIRARFRFGLDWAKTVRVRVSTYGRFYLRRARVRVM